MELLAGTSFKKSPGAPRQRPVQAGATEPPEPKGMFDLHLSSAAPKPQGQLLRASRTPRGVRINFNRRRGAAHPKQSVLSVTLVAPAQDCFPGTAPCLPSTANTSNEGFISPSSCQLRSRQADSVNSRMLIFPLSIISKPKQHLEPQPAIQRETDYNWKKLHISFPSFTHFCFYLNFPHVPSKTAPQGEELSPSQRLPNTM